MRNVEPCLSKLKNVQRLIAFACTVLLLVENKLYRSKKSWLLPKTERLNTNCKSTKIRKNKS